MQSDEPTKNPTNMQSDESTKNPTEQAGECMLICPFQCIHPSIWKYFALLFFLFFYDLSVIDNDEHVATLLDMFTVSKAVSQDQSYSSVNYAQGKHISAGWTTENFWINSVQLRDGKMIATIDMSKSCRIEFDALRKYAFYLGASQGLKCVDKKEHFQYIFTSTEGDNPKTDKLTDEVDIGFHYALRPKVHKNLSFRRKANSQLLFAVYPEQSELIFEREEKIRLKKERKKLSQDKKPSKDSSSLAYQLYRHVIERGRKRKREKDCHSISGDESNVPGTAGKKSTTELTSEDISTAVFPSTSGDQSTSAVPSTSAVRLPSTAESLKKKSTATSDGKSLSSALGATVLKDSVAVITEIPKLMTDKLANSRKTHEIPKTGRSVPALLKTRKSVTSFPDKPVKCVQLEDRLAQFGRKVYIVSNGLISSIHTLDFVQFLSL